MNDNLTITDIAGFVIVFGIILLSMALIFGPIADGVREYNAGAANQVTGMLNIAAVLMSNYTIVVMLGIFLIFLGVAYYLEKM